MAEDKKSEDIAEESNINVEPQPEEEQSTEPANEEPGTTDEEISDDGEETVEDENAEPAEPKGPNVFQKLWKRYAAHKKIAIPVTVLVLLGLIFGLPLTRYAVLGLGLKNDLRVRVVDNQTSIAVSGVDVTIRGKTAKTDGEGKATIRGVTVGPYNLTAAKKYYKDYTTKTTVPISKQKNDVEVRIEASGRPVAIHITNKITGKNIGGAIVKAADTQSQTDDNGETTLVLPADKTTAEGVISASGYNDQKVTINIGKSTVKDNSFQLAPAGKIYFLSKLSGKIDVVKTDLDGSNRQTVLAGTGKEDEGNTVLLAARDWKYLALLSRRESDKARLYLIDTSNDKLTEIDSGNAAFTLVGWADHHFMYTVDRDVRFWQPKKYALKTYNADSGQLLTIDETNGEGTGNGDYAYESFGIVSIIDGQAIYTKTWYADYYSVYRLAGKRMGIIGVKANGLEKKTIKDFNAGNNNYISTVLSEPNELYIRVSIGESVSFYEYENGAIKDDKETNDESFYKPYPTFLQSPGGQNTFWSESRDGKNALFVGNKNAESPGQIASLSELVPYGWFTDEYLLVSKSSSELYILPKAGGRDPLKITDYHRPDTTYSGYGAGYGGL